MCGQQLGCSDFTPLRECSPPLSLPAGVWCRYFAEAPTACHSMCDNCLRQLKVTRQDVSAAAAAVVQTLQALPAADKRLTLTQLVDAWRKSQVQPVALPTHPVPIPCSPHCSHLAAFACSPHSLKPFFFAVALLNCCGHHEPIQKPTRPRAVPCVGP